MLRAQLKLFCLMSIVPKSDIHSLVDVEHKVWIFPGNFYTEDDHLSSFDFNLF